MYAAENFIYFVCGRKVHTLSNRKDVIAAGNFIKCENNEKHALKDFLKFLWDFFDFHIIDSLPL